MLLSRGDITKENKPHNVTLCNSQLVHGFLCDKQTMLPLPARNIFVRLPNDLFHASAISQVDGYFQLVLPKLDAELELTIAGANVYKTPPEPQILPAKSLANSLALLDSYDSSRQLVIKPEGNANKLVVMVEGGYSSDSSVAWSGSSLKYEYEDLSYDRTLLTGYALNAPLFGESEPLGEPPRVPANTDKPVVREIQLRTTKPLRGRLLDLNDQPVAWYQLAVLRKGDNPQTFWTSSHGRFATSLVPQDQQLTLSMETETTVVDKARDLGDVIAVSRVGNVSFDRYAKGTIFFTVRRREQVRVPKLDYHVDRWIHGQPMPIDKLDRRLPVLVVHAQDVPIAKLQLLSDAFPKNKLTIIAIYYPDDENPTALEALTDELALRKCTFSVGVDAASKIQHALNVAPLLFNFPSDEVFLVPRADISIVRNIMLHMRSQE